MKVPAASHIAIGRVKSGELRSGAVYALCRAGAAPIEAKITQMLGVGRTPVNHAVHRLAADGLLEIIPRKGILIRPESIRDFPFAVVP